MITITFECCWESSWSNPIDAHCRLTSALFSIESTKGSSWVGRCNKTREMSSVRWTWVGWEWMVLETFFCWLYKLDMRPRFRLCRIGDFLGSFLVGSVSIGLCLHYKYIKSLRLKVDVLMLLSVLSERDGNRNWCGIRFAIFENNLYPLFVFVLVMCWLCK